MKPAAALTILREMGPRWLAWRAAYEASVRTGLFRVAFRPEQPIASLARSLSVPLADLMQRLYEMWLQTPSQFFFEGTPGATRDYVVHQGSLVNVADSVLRGRYLYFSRWWADLGQPPDWLLNPVDGRRFPGRVHWSRIPDLSLELGDIKYVWEASRFSHAYYLARAFAVTGDDRYAEGFWRDLEHWVKQNPPEMGPNWRCGQEISLRTLAWIFALYALKDSPAITPERVGLLLAYVWYQAQHVEKIHWYAARCVRNNHALSEAAALFTVGILFPFLPGALRWQRKGFRYLVQEGSWQIYPDGSYVQHSTNYCRLVAQLFTWCLRLGQLNGIEFPPALRARVEKLLDFLWSLQDPRTGRVPNYGSNDGALVFPLSSCDYLDYRPSLNALSIALRGRRLYEPGPWDEEAFWFCGEHAVRSAPREERIRSSAAFSEGGYYVLRSESAFAMVRCGRYRHRPAQADMLHVDLWYRGHNVLVDPGTFSYNAAPQWVGYFVGTASHNTVTVDGRDQMKKGGRFLWYNWVHGRTLSFERIGQVWLFQGEHSGYRPVVHRRLVALRGETLLVIDDLFGDPGEEHTYDLHWQLNDFPLTPLRSGARLQLGDGQEVVLRLGCTCPATLSWGRAEESPPRGWQSLYYGEKTPARSLRLRAISSEPVRFFTLIGPCAGAGPADPLSASEVEDLVSQWGLGQLNPIGDPRGIVTPGGIGG